MPEEQPPLPAVIDLSTLIGGGDSPRELPTKVVSFEFAGAATQAYVIQSKSYIRALIRATADIMVAVKSAGFMPASIMGGSTTRLLDSCVICDSQTLNAVAVLYMNHPMDAGDTLYVKKTSPGASQCNLVIAYTPVTT